MSLFSSRTHPSSNLTLTGLRDLVRGAWRAYRHSAAALASLERLLASGDDHLLRDIGIDRETGYRLAGATLVIPHRAWDRWQL